MAANSHDTASTFPSLTHAAPSNTSIVVPCNILGGHLWVGLFLKLTGNCIVRYVGNCNDVEAKLIGNLFVSYGDEELNTVDNTYLKGLKGREIVQTLDSILFTFDDISDIAFVFSLHHISKDGLMLHGISNAYVCRYCISSNTTVPVDIIPFPCEYPGYTLWGPSFPKRVWTCIMTIQKTFRQLLSVKSEKQGFYVPNKKKTILFQAEGWNYIVLRFSFADVFATSTTRSTIAHKLLSGFSRVSVRQVEEAQSLIVSAPQHLKSLQNIFGTFVLFGSRFSRPKLGTISHLHENCSMNIISGILSSDDLSNGESKFFPTKVQFTMCHTTTELVVSVSYGLYLYTTNPLSGEPVKCPSTSLRNLIMNFRSVAAVSHDNQTTQQQQQHHIDGVSLSVIRAGCRFTRDGVLYKVVIADGVDGVVCKTTGPSTDRNHLVNLPYIEVARRILDRVKGAASH